MSTAVMLGAQSLDFINPARPSALAGGLFGRGVAAAERSGGGDAALLFPDERNECAGAAPKRVAEFAAGRLCVRRALAELGLKGFALARNADRSPAWPAGFTGAITHTLGYCAAAVARCDDFAALGLDAEIVGRVTPEVWPYIFTLAEFARVEALPARRQAAFAALIFSAKEAFYKCQHALTGQWLEFGDVGLELDDEREATGGFEVRPLRELGSPLLAGRRLRGRFAFVGELVVTGIALAVQQ